jgi:N-ethylmaleimide reductase
MQDGMVRRREALRHASQAAYPAAAAAIARITTMSHSGEPALFKPLRIGDIELKNRIVMAPLTRNRATRGSDAPNELNVEYYRQRAGAGLIVTEGTQVSQQGQGYVWTPGIYSEAQTTGWKAITDAVHAEGGKIIAQLWHVGRVSHVSLQPDNAAPVSPSPIQAKTKTYIESGFAEVSTPRELSLDEIPAIISEFVAAAENAKAAGFDGVELHGAHGYLIDQFLRDDSNKRTDRYGGSIENRVRFAIEVVEAVSNVFGKGRVGIRISPVSPANDARDSNPQALFEHLVARLNDTGIAFIHVVEGATRDDRNYLPFDYGALRKGFKGAYIGNNLYTRELAIEAVETDAADAIAFGRLFIANPDLVERLKRDAPLNQPVVETFYGGDAKGYTDYPALAGKAA